MPSWKPNFNPDYFYFVTTKAVDHLHLERDVFKRIILDTFDYFRIRQAAQTVLLRRHAKSHTFHRAIYQG